MAVRSKGKRIFLYLSVTVLFVLLLSFYYMVKTINQETGDQVPGKQETFIKDVQDRIDKIQKKIKETNDGISKMQKLLKEDPSGRLKMASSINVFPPVGDSCKFFETKPLNTNIQMNKVVDELPFDNIDGGVWKQGWPVTYADSDFTPDRPLKVFVVPHSHCDPGWLKTFQQYYDDQVRGILSNALNILPQNKKRRFIYAEMSFFNLFWSSQDRGKHEAMKSLLNSGQMEIVTGGWVMPDEANSHYFAMVDQLIEGHEFMQNELNIKPKSGWAIDPFGHSPTMAYILKRAGLKHMLIQRIHYSVKKYLARTKQLEFNWMQPWDTTGSTSMKCHMMPFYSYDVPHTCGPDPAVCCQFDFARLPGSRYSCPWRKPPRPITNANVQSRAETLLDQYRKKSSLYKTNVVLIPLGDDFRYDMDSEFHDQVNNYEKLFAYMNSRKDWNVQAQFGTLSEYFNALETELSVSGGRTPMGLPTLSGDFYTYADRDDHYWSGYFTSRPFYKRLDRVLESHLRSSEIVFSLAQSVARRHSVHNYDHKSLLNKLVTARRALGLFQHHDGITGTAKTHVNDDYGKRMLEALAFTREVMEESSALLMSNEHQNTEKLRVLRVWQHQRGDATIEPLQITDRRQGVILYNSLGWPRSELVTLDVQSDAPVLVRDPDGKPILSQVNPLWSSGWTASSEVIRVSFIAEVPALGFSRYVIELGSIEDFQKYAHIVDGKASVQVSKPFKVTDDYRRGVSMENAYVKLDFSEKGLLQATTSKSSGKRIETDLHFVHYAMGQGKGGERSGAYLFFPASEASRVNEEVSSFVLEKGPVFDKIIVKIGHMITHTLILEKGSGITARGPMISNLVDLESQNNYELAMRLSTNVQNKNREFFSDLNGFQLLRRRTLDKVPMQANFYPMPSLAGLEDDTHRLTVLSGQSLGVASLKQGQIEVMLDRRLNQDDNRGLGQGVTDTKRTPNTFRLLLEPASRPLKLSLHEQPSIFASLLAHHTSLALTQPLYQLGYSSSGSELRKRWSLLAAPLPCDLHLLNFRARQRQARAQDPNGSSEAALILHRLGYDCRFVTVSKDCSLSNAPSIGQMFTDSVISKATTSSLTMLYDQEPVDLKAPVKVDPMELQTYIVQL